MDLENNDSDSSISLDHTWLVLSENEVNNNYGENISSLLEKNIDTESSNSEINPVNEDKFIRQDLPIDEAKIGIDIEEKNNLLNTKTTSEEIQSEELAKTNICQLVPVDDQQSEIKENIDTKNQHKFSDKRIIIYKVDVSKCVTDFIFLLATISVGTFFISFCGLSLMFLTHSNWQLAENNSSFCQDLAAKHYTFANHHNTWFSNYYPSFDEEEMALNSCTNKYKQSAFKNKDGCKKYSERRMKHFMRPYVVNKIIKKKTKVSVNGPLNEHEFYRKVMDEQAENYKSLQKDFNDQQYQYESLKNQCRLKNELNKQCIKLMLKEIVQLSKEVKAANKPENQIPVPPRKEEMKEKQMKVDPQKAKSQEAFTQVNSNLYYLIDKNVLLNKTSDEHLTRVKLNKSNFNFTSLESKSTLTEADKEKGIATMEKKVKEMVEENERVANDIKEKQKELFELTNDIASSIRFLEYKKYMLNIYQVRLENMKTKSEEDKEGKSPNEIINRNKNTSLIPVNVPLNFMDNKHQQSMSQAMLDEIMNSTVSKQDAKNICLCEQDEEEYPSEKFNETMQLEEKRRELNNLITNRLLKLQSEPPKPLRKSTCLAKWDEKTIWISRKLNDLEHSRLVNLYPKCNPLRCWIRNKKHKC